MGFEELLVLGGVLATSTLSGILGMGGGIILMGLFSSFMPVVDAMLLHGLAQLTSNGTRSILHRRYWRLAMLPSYLTGAVLVTLALGFAAFVPPKALVFLLLGVFPYLSFVVPALGRLNIQRPYHAGVAGIIVTGLQILAGASGPILDVFFFNAGLSKHEVVANKAVTQALGHILKILFYCYVGQGLSQSLSLRPILPGLAVVAALAGTLLGTFFLDRLSEQRFRTWSRYAILLIGAYYIYLGVSGFWA